MQQIDALRAAVVLAHAALEDVVRSSSEELLPSADAKVLNEIGFPDGQGRTKEKVMLGDLHAYKSRTVDDVIREAVQLRLQRSSYNSVTEVAGALERIGLSPEVLSPHESILESLMKRRHLIVHRADKNPLPDRGPGIPLTVHLPKPTVEAWLDAVESTGEKIAAALPFD